ncbi:MAG: hypothetical protein SVN78_11050, partial [Deferribacterota bacterium]|nr:hypothetical protein [Deferribacterota bacterium]
YNKKFRKEDIDHIHPSSILKSRGYNIEEINTVVNYQLLDFSLNRGDKNSKELKDWVNNIANKRDYLNRHLIPECEDLWDSVNYKDFLDVRKKMIADKLKDRLNI